MNDRFDDEQDLSQPLHEITNRTLELDARQRAIYQGLKDIGEEIAAFYLDGLKILQDDNLQTSASLLAYVAREIDGGLRDILSTDEAKSHIQSQLTEEILSQLGEYNELRERKGHIASILAALGIDNARAFLSTSDVRVNVAIRWINVSTQFHRFAHRHGAWRVPRAREEFEALWYEQDCEGCTQLYGDYFLIPPRFYDAMDMDVQMLAVNAEFITQFGSLSQQSPRTSGLKEPNNEFKEKAPKEGNHDILDSLFFRHQEKGLYIIGIRKPQDA